MNKPARPVLSLKTKYESAPVAVEPPAPETHAPVILLEDHGFVTDIGAVYSRRAGVRITNPLEIAMLKSRGVSMKDA